MQLGSGSRYPSNKTMSSSSPSGDADLKRVFVAFQAMENRVDDRLATVERSIENLCVNTEDQFELVEESLHAGPHRNHMHCRNLEGDEDSEHESYAGGSSRHNHECDPDEWILKSVRLEAPAFDETMDPKIFTDWISDIDQSFKWYEMLEP